MSETALKCPRCDAPLTGAAPGGLCPACMRRVAVLGETMFSAEVADSLDGIVVGERAAPAWAGHIAQKHAGPSAWNPPSLGDMQDVLPQYEFIRLLGRGGMGAVYEARQVSLDRPVAVKVLPAALMEHDEAGFVARFKQEARTLARMKHPAIVQVHDFGETADGLLYFVMEHVEGTDLARMVAEKGRLPAETAVSIAIRVCDALACAHAQGIIHRDIKPANVLVDPQGEVKVADFGLAKAVDGGATSKLTRTGIAVGTPEFLAPEALAGIPLDARADIYAVGVMLFNMLTGRLPRDKSTRPGANHDGGARLDAIIAKALQADRGQRHQSAVELRRELEAWLAPPVNVPVHSRLAPEPPAMGGGDGSTTRGTVRLRLPAAAEMQSMPVAGTAKPVRRGRSGAVAGILLIVVAAVVAWWLWRARV